jgi:hypothetical protein
LFIHEPEPDELGELLALDPELDEPEFDEPEFDEEDVEPESPPLGTADPVVGLSAGRPRSCAHAGERLSVTAAARPIENRRSVITSPSPETTVQSSNHSAS